MQPTRSFRPVRQFGRRQPRTGAYKAELDGIARRERRQLAYYLFLAAAAGIVLSLALYVFTVPVSRHEVGGSIVSFRTDADDEGPVRRYVGVQLDDSRTVWARVHGFPVLKIGRRVRLIETTTALIGWKRHGFLAFDDQEPRVTAPD